MKASMEEVLLKAVHTIRRSVLTAPAKPTRRQSFLRGLTALRHTSTDASESFANTKTRARSILRRLSSWGAARTPDDTLTSSNSDSDDYPDDDLLDDVNDAGQTDPAPQGEGKSPPSTRGLDEMRSRKAAFARSMRSPRPSSPPSRRSMVPGVDYDDGTSWFDESDAITKTRQW